MKKIISVLICALVFLQLLPMTVFAGEDDFGYRNNPDGETISVYYLGEDETVTIPLTIDGKKVTGIDSNGFHKCESLKRIIIPEGITVIEEYAFTDCSKLESVELPESLKRIGEYAFDGCKRLKSIVIPANVQYLEENFFYNYSLESIRVAEDNPYFDSRDNCNAIIRTRDNCLIKGCQNTVIPEGVAKIEDYAFCGCNGLIEIKIPISVQRIGGGAFYDSPLERIYYAGSVANWERIKTETGLFLTRDFFYCPVIFAHKIKGRVSLKPQKVTYNGKPIEYDFNDLECDRSIGCVSYDYYMDKACTKLTTPKETGCRIKGEAPKYAGVYYVKAKVDSDWTYSTTVSNAVRFEIQPKVVAYRYINMNGSYYLGVQLDGIQKSVKTYYMKLYKSTKSKPLKTTGKYKPTKRAATKPAGGFEKGKKYYVKIFFKGKNRKLSPLVLSPKKFIN